MGTLRCAAVPVKHPERYIDSYLQAVFNLTVKVKGVVQLQPRHVAQKL